VGTAGVPSVIERPFSAKSVAQQESVWARRAAGARALAEKMPGFVDKVPQTSEALADYLAIRRATLYRRFGPSPVRGAYVLACCHYLVPAWRALVVHREQAEEFPGLWASRRRALRALAYVLIAAIAPHRRLFERGLMAAGSGAMMRDVDLIALIGHGAQTRLPTTLGLDPRGVVPRSFEHIPVLSDCVASFLSFLEITTPNAPELARQILEVSLASKGTNTMGEANKVLAWAGTIDAVADDRGGAPEEMWLATRLLERQAAGPPGSGVSHLVRLLGDKGA
jgi:hypothetical protein